MSHDWNATLEEVEAALSAQDQQLTLLRESLTVLPSHASIALSKEWKNAFEEAIDPVVSFKRTATVPPPGAIRA
jgi:hypothetical protein